MSKQLVSVASSSLLERAIALTVYLAIACWGNSVFAQITPDGTLGAENSAVTPNVNIQGSAADQIDGGAIRGSNLFHSLREFNIKDGQRVYFSNPSGIKNILGRVTGKEPSDILGTLGVNGNANLFLLNPNGIIFGQNASLDVRGSFVASTANAIQFGELGEFSASNPQSPSSLLTINPSAFFFNVGTKPGSIINQSRATQTLQGIPTDGLQVPNGQTLLLLGGNVTVDDGHLIARGGRVEIGAVAGTGNVGLNANGSLSFPDTIQRADVVFNDRALTDVTLANAGDIGITARNIDLLQGSGLLAGIKAGLGTADSQAGDITLNATGEVRITAPLSRIENNVSPNAIGKGGNVKITANTLVLSNGGQLNANTLGTGDTGNISIAVRDRVALNGRSADGQFGSHIFSAVGQDAKGKLSNIQISANTLEISDGAQVGAVTFGVGDAGNVTITANRVFLSGRSRDGKFASAIGTGVEEKAIGKGGNLEIFTNNLEISNGAQLTSVTSGIGNAGNILISARERVFLNNSDAVSRVNSTGRGNSGNIQIATNTLEVTNLSQLSASTLGIGDAGNVIITANRVSIIDSDVLSRVGRTGRGKGGNVQITANTLEAINGGSLIVNTLGIGDAGNVIINARDRVLFSGQSADGKFTAGAFSEVFLPNARGNGGNIQIATKTLEVTNGAQLFTGTGGIGNAGNIVISADRVIFSGISASGLLPSVAYSSAASTAKGKGGDIQITANTLEVLNGGELQSITQGKGDAGNIIVNASNAVNIAGSKSGLFTFTSASSQYKGGDIRINAPIFKLANGAALDARTFGDGKSGNITVSAGTVDIANSGMFVRSQGSGGAGNITISSPKIRLKQGILSAESATADGGNITLNPRDLLLLRNHSLISATAGTAQQNGNGGNITINAPKGFIIASPNENSDITANAFQGRGGNIKITAQGIFGLQFRKRETSLSDITASSEFGIAGVVEIDIPEVDPSQGLEELPIDIVDVAGLINQNLCVAGQGSEFVVTGRGGLPASPKETLNADTAWEDWRIAGANKQPVREKPSAVTHKRSPTKDDKPERPIEAQGWIVAANGKPILTAEPVTVTPQGTWLHPLDCQRLKENL